MSQSRSLKLAAIGFFRSHFTSVLCHAKFLSHVTVYLFLFLSQFLILLFAYWIFQTNYCSRFTNLLTLFLSKYPLLVTWAIIWNILDETNYLCPLRSSESIICIHWCLCIHFNCFYNLYWIWSCTFLLQKIVIFMILNQLTPPFGYGVIFTIPSKSRVYLLLFYNI